MRKVQDKIAELQAEHAAQIEAVTAQYGALLQQVGPPGCGWELLLQVRKWGWAPGDGAVRRAAAAGSGCGWVLFWNAGAEAHWQRGCRLAPASHNCKRSAAHSRLPSKYALNVMLPLAPCLLRWRSTTAAWRRPCSLRLRQRWRSRPAACGDHLSRCFDHWLLALGTAQRAAGLGNLLHAPVPCCTALGHLLPLAAKAPCLVPSFSIAFAF